VWPFTKSAKIGRNDPCWCGSGRKYKKCHLDHDRDNQPHSIGESFGIFRRAQKSAEPKLCLYPKERSDPCQGRIINCHTVQNRGGLTQIAVDGQVLGFDQDQARMVKTGNISVQPLGIRKASTFTGFCEHHDNSVFAEVEDRTFVPTKRQCFLLAYRGICREFYKKRAQDSVAPVMQRLAGPEDTKTQHYSIAVSRGLDDISRLKKEFDNILISGDLNRVKCFAVIFSDTPKVACTSALFPYNDFNDRIVQELDNLDVDVQGFGFSLTPTDSGGAAVFGFLDGSQACDAFVEGIHSTALEDLPDALVRFVFSNFENTFFSPEWWKRLPDTTQDTLINRVNTAISLEKGVPSHLDDGLRVADWSASDMFFVEE